MCHGNLPFTASENPYFLKFINAIRPSYNPPTAYVLSHSIMDSEAAHVRLQEGERITQSKLYTFLIDGWEDLLKRSLYGSVLAEVKQYPIVLSLEDLTGERANATGVVDAAMRALESRGLEDGKRLVAMVTDDPTTMGLVRKLMKAKFWWIIVRPVIAFSIHIVFLTLS